MLSIEQFFIILISISLNMLVASFVMFLWMLGSVKNHSSSLPLHTAASEIVISISIALETK